MGPDEKQNLAGCGFWLAAGLGRVRGDETDLAGRPAAGADAGPDAGGGTRPVCRRFCAQLFQPLGECGVFQDADGLRGGARRLTGTDTKTHTWTIPKVIYTSGDITPSGPGELSLSLKFTALYNSGTTNKVSIDRTV